jgi:spoIIIJ-associated protein
MKLSNQAIEITAKTLDEAKRTAAEHLGVSVDQLNVTVLEEKKRLFGLAQVKISAEVIAKQETKSKPAKPTKPKAKPANSESEVDKIDSEVEVPQMPTSKAKKPLFGKTVQKSPPEAPSPTVEAKEDLASEQGEEIQAKPRTKALASEVDADVVSKELKHLLKLAGLDVSIQEVGLQERYVQLLLDGEDAGLVIGKRGETLNAFQFILNLVAAQKLSNGVRVVLDGDHYRTRREQSLKKLARQVAKEVVQRGEEAVLDALPAIERRVVHQALEDFKGIKTYSEGDEPNRRVVIAPLN